MNFPDVVGMEDGTVLIPTYDWKGFLKPYFIDLKKIKSKPHFRMTDVKIGYVYTKETFENISKDEKILPLRLPDIINQMVYHMSVENIFKAKLDNFVKKNPWTWYVPQLIVTLTESLYSLVFNLLYI